MVAPDNVLFFERRPGSDKPWTKTMTRANLDEFVACYRPGDRHSRKPTWSEKESPEGRWRAYFFDEISARDKCSLDLFPATSHAETGSLCKFLDGHHIGGLTLTLQIAVEKLLLMRSLGSEWEAAMSGGCRRYKTKR